MAIYNPETADRLRKECEKLGLKFKVKPMSFGHGIYYQIGTQFFDVAWKSFLYLDQIRRAQGGES